MATLCPKVGNSVDQKSTILPFGLCSQLKLSENSYNTFVYIKSYQPYQCDIGKFLSFSPDFVFYTTLPVYVVWKE